MNRRSLISAGVGSVLAIGGVQKANAQNLARAWRADLVREKVEVAKANDWTTVPWTLALPAEAEPLTILVQFTAPVLLRGIGASGGHDPHLYAACRIRYRDVVVAVQSFGESQKNLRSIDSWVVYPLSVTGILTVVANQIATIRVEVYTRDGTRAELNGGPSPHHRVGGGTAMLLATEVRAV